MRRRLLLAMALAALATAAPAAEPKPGTRDTLPGKAPTRSKSGEAQVAPGAPREAAPEQAATAGPFFVDVGCDGQQLALETQNAEQRARGVSGTHTGGVQSWTLCARPGWLSYQWSLTDLQPPEAQGRLRLEGISGNRARLVFEPLLSEYARKFGSGSLFTGGKLSVQASRPSPQGVAQGLPASRSLELALSVVVSDVPRPSLTSYWIDEYRPGRSGTLARQGILDPGALASPDTSDGVVTIEGRALNQPPAEIFIHSSAGQHQGTVLSRSSQNGMDRVVIKFSGFRGGLLRARNPYGGSDMDLPRLHYRVLDTGTLGALAGGLSIVVGDPAGKGRITLGEDERGFDVASFHQSGANVNVVGMRSSSVSFAFLPGAKPDSVTLRMQVPFETAGEEIEGTWRAAAGAPPVDVGGHLTSPQLEIRVQLRPGGNGASVTGAYLETSFSFGLQLTAAGVGFPLGPLEDHIEKRVNQGLLASMQEMGMAQTLATAINLLIPHSSESRIRELEHHAGKLFVDLVED